MRRRADYPAEEVITTRWADQDAYGHINNVVYFSYVDTAVNSYLMRATGVDTRELAAIGVVAHSSCDFMRELQYPSEVAVGLLVTRLGNSSITYELAVFQGEHESPAAVVRFVHVYVDRDTRKSAPIPELIREAAQRLTIPTE
ncbi:MAG: acyl-CoA thioesterase [Leucobacter sp.]|jgi:acyl-CoA thioester hydrolase|nr:acyl-CoA thioesterase [Leucobacter sp.]